MSGAQAALAGTGRDLRFTTTAPLEVANTGLRGRFSSQPSPHADQSCRVVPEPCTPGPGCGPRSPGRTETRLGASDGRPSSGPHESAVDRFRVHAIWGGPESVRLNSARTGSRGDSNEDGSVSGRRPETADPLRTGASRGRTRFGPAPCEAAPGPHSALPSADPRRAGTVRGPAGSEFTPSEGRPAPVRHRARGGRFRFHAKRGPPRSGPAPCEGRPVPHAGAASADRFGLRRPRVGRFGDRVAPRLADFGFATNLAGRFGSAIRVGWPALVRAKRVPVEPGCRFDWGSTVDARQLVLTHSACVTSIEPRTRRSLRAFPTA